MRELSSDTDIVRNVRVKMRRLERNVINRYTAQNPKPTSSIPGDALCP